MPRRICAVLAFLSLALCLLFPILCFLQRLSVERYKFGLLSASIAWFVFAGLWASAPKKTKKGG